MRFFNLVLILLLFAPELAKADSWSAKMVDYGTYEIMKGGKVSNDSVAGDLTISYAKKLIQQGDQVTANIGTTFGFRYILIGPEDETEVTVRVIHPKPLKDPDSGREFATSEWSQTVPTDHTNWNTGWIFENDWEIVPGKWVMQLLVDNKVLLEKTFSITDGRVK